MYGGGANDILIGNEGRDYLFGRGGEDLLIGGVSAASDDELLDALAEWSADNSYESRAETLVALLGASSSNDGAADLLVGQGGQDLFFGGAEERVLGRRSNEWLHTL